MKKNRTSAPSLNERAQCLEQALAAAEGVAEDERLDQARAVLEKVGRRQSVNEEYTVVGFFGATGSGKSSLFNAVAQADLAGVAVTRPATRTARAAVWGRTDPRPLLDWLEVDAVHHLGRDLPGSSRPGRGSGPWQSLFGGRSGTRGRDGEPEQGLILLDLPDFDSIDAENRALAQRFAARVDVMVWVFDPQKYADHAVHHEFLRPLAEHGGKMLAVLNQADRLSEQELAAVLTDLQGQLGRDGAARLLSRAPLGASARTGLGLDELTAGIAEVVTGSSAVRQRLHADLDGVVSSLAAQSGGEPVRGYDEQVSAALGEGLYEAVGGPRLVQASVTAHRRRNRAQVGWPPLRWVVRAGRDPLRRLGISRPTGEHGSISRQDLPDLDAAGQAQASGAVRQAAEESSAGLEEPWHHAVRDAARDHAEELPEELERAVAGADLAPRRARWWWGPLNLLQWLAFLLLLGGILWLSALFLGDYFRLALPEPPQTGQTRIPVPTAVVVLGAVLGLLLSLLGRWVSAASARRHGRRLAEQLRGRCTETGDRCVGLPVHEVLERQQEMVRSLREAQRTV